MINILFHSSINLLVVFLRNDRVLLKPHRLFNICRLVFYCNIQPKNRRKGF